MSLSCTPYVSWDGWDESEPWEILLRCPECKGWLPRDFPLDEPFKCKRCGTELLTFPVYDEDGELLMDQGKICQISNTSRPVPSPEVKQT